MFSLAQYSLLQELMLQYKFYIPNSAEHLLGGSWQKVREEGWSLWSLITLFVSAILNQGPLRSFQGSRRGPCDVGSARLALQAWFTRWTQIEIHSIKIIQTCCDHLDLSVFCIRKTTLLSCPQNTPVKTLHFLRTELNPTRLRAALGILSGACENWDAGCSHTFIGHISWDVLPNCLALGLLLL